MTTRRFDAVIFDYGGVLSTSPFEDLAGMARSMGLDPHQFRELVTGAYGEDGSEPLHRLERGEITLAQWRQALEAKASSNGMALEPPEIIGDRFFRCPPVRPHMLDTVEVLRRDGYRTAVLTNAVRDVDEWRSAVRSDALFDVVIASWEVGLRKPHPKIFQLTADRLGVEPSRTVLLDDCPAHVAAAESIGMAAILVTDIDAAVARLEFLLADGDSAPEGKRSQQTEPTTT